MLLDYSEDDTPFSKAYFVPEEATGSVDFRVPSHYNSLARENMFQDNWS